MRGKVISGTMLMLVLISMLSLAFNIQLVESETATIFVPDDYEKIQWAIGNATDGDTIFVRAGIYYEHVKIDKRLNIHGENRETTVIDGSHNGTVVGISSDNVTITGFTIREHGEESSNSGIAVGTNNNNITGNKVTTRMPAENITHGGEGPPRTYGILLGSSSNNHVSHNFITDHENTPSIYLRSHGIGLTFDSNNNTISNNNVFESEFGIFFVYRSNNNVIYHNNLINNNRQVAVTMYSYNNTWNNGFPSGGNYWSDYTTRYPNAQELDDSGIWDTPYVIDENNQDNYPLMEPLTPSPSEAMQELIETIETWGLHHGTENSLTAKLEGTLHLLDIGNENGALHKLKGFINQVEAQRGKKLTDDQADYLTTEAQRIIDLINE